MFTAQVAEFDRLRTKLVNVWEKLRENHDEGADGHDERTKRQDDAVVHELTDVAEQQREESLNENRHTLIHWTSQPTLIN